MIDQHKITKAIAEIAEIFDRDELTKMEVMAIVCSFLAVIITESDQGTYLKKYFKDLLDITVNQIEAGRTS